MRAIEFFNLFPEEVELIKQRYQMQQSFEKIAKQTGQQINILRRTEAALLVKITSGFRHCGVKMSCDGLREALLKGKIEIKEE